MIKSSTKSPIDPMVFLHTFWPHVNLYKQQEEIVYSVVNNVETYAVAGNELGKDFIAAFIIIWFFCSRRPARVVATSVTEMQLIDILWGEITWFLNNAQGYLPIKQNQGLLRQVYNDGSYVDNTEVRAKVTNANEGLLGRHSKEELWSGEPEGFMKDDTVNIIGGFSDNIPRTLVVFDEASAVDDETYTGCLTWSDRRLIIGNPWPCTNFFYRNSKEGDREHLAGSKETGLYRKVIKITAKDSPNVRLAEKEIERDGKPSGRILIPGVKKYDDYLMNREFWDEELQCVGLDAEWYEGPGTLLFPPKWLKSSAKQAEKLRKDRRPTHIGIDPAEGGDNTSMAAGDDLGLIELVSEKTPDTNEIFEMIVKFIKNKKWDINPANIYFDRGGGGKQHADRLRASGYNVNTIDFGGSATPAKKRGMTQFDERVRTEEERSIYKNRRAEMYDLLSMALDPYKDSPFALPQHLLDKSNRGKKSLRDQLRVIPRLTANEGKMYLPPKQKNKENSKERTMIEIVGHSPDEVDALVLLMYGLRGRKPKPATVEVVI